MKSMNIMDYSLLIAIEEKERVPVKLEQEINLTKSTALFEESF
jgi:hypothetical protein